MSNCDTVHIDDKWFYVTSEGEAYWLTDEEDVEYCASKSKRFVKKMMFMAALARPRFDANYNMIFDGKIGISPFTNIMKAKSPSKNRPNGTNELKPVVFCKEERG